MKDATLHLFSGLPGVGKTALSKALAAHREAVYLRIDTVEQALRDLYRIEIGSEGYRLAYRIAADNLALGIGVVADSCNTIAETRRAWEDVAVAASAVFVNIEVVCSDADEHRRRVERRAADIPTLVLPDWESVMARDYEPWDRERIRIDTAGRSPEESMSVLLTALSDGDGGS